MVDRPLLASLSSGGGRAKLTDDDWFRMIFAGVGALVGVLVVLVVWPGFSSWILNSGRDLFELLDTRFGEGNGGDRSTASGPTSSSPATSPTTVRPAGT